MTAGRWGDLEDTLVQPPRSLAPEATLCLPQRRWEVPLPPLAFEKDSCHPERHLPQKCLAQGVSAMHTAHDHVSAAEGRTAATCTLARCGCPFLAGEGQPPALPDLLTVLPGAQTHDMSATSTARRKWLRREGSAHNTRLAVASSRNSCRLEPKWLRNIYIYYIYIYIYACTL